MTKKDYEVIARVIATWRKSAEIVANGNSIPDKGYGASLLAAVTCDLADEFRKANPRFDHGRFHTACRSMMQEP